MKMQVYSLYDAAIGAYAKPFFMQSVGQALRGLKDLLADHNSEVAKHPEDYILFKLGEFDDETGKFVSDGPVSIANCVELVSEARNRVPNQADIEDVALKAVGEKNA